MTEGQCWKVVCLGLCVERPSRLSAGDAQSKRQQELRGTHGKFSRKFLGEAVAPRALKKRVAVGLG